MSLWRLFQLYKSNKQFLLGVRKMKTFRQWLLTKLNEDSPIGYLANDAFNDDGWTGDTSISLISRMSVFNLQQNIIEAWEEADKQYNLYKSNKKLYKFKIDFHYGELEGLFISTDEKIAELYNQTIYFGEVLGKHSEVEADIKPHHIIFLTDDQYVISHLEEKCDGSTISGINPLNYVKEAEEG